VAPPRPRVGGASWAARGWSGDGRGGERGDVGGTETGATGGR
jgi:hypothetical protein